MTAGVPDFSGLLAQAQQMQQQMIDAQAGLGELRAQGSAGGGLVTAVVDGRGDLLALTIAPAAVDTDDPDYLETVADLVVAAVRDAKAEAERLASEQISAATSGFAALGGALGGLLGDVGLPGLDEGASGQDDDDDRPSGPARPADGGADR